MGGQIVTTRSLLLALIVVMICGEDYTLNILL